MQKRGYKRAIVTKTVMAKKPNGKIERIKIKYSRMDLSKPVYLIRSE